MLSIYTDFLALMAMNRTIDDTLGDSVTGEKPIYMPSFNVWGSAQDCPNCVLIPDRSKAFETTWTAATYLPDMLSMSIQFSFQGTAVYVYFILANGMVPHVTTATICDFYLDGGFAGSLRNSHIGSFQFEYSALVFSKSDLPNADHNLTILASGSTQHIYVNFDYAIYTFEDITNTTLPSSSQMPSPQTSPLITLATSEAAPTPSTSTLISTASSTSTLISVPFIQVPSSASSQSFIPPKVSAPQSIGSSSVHHTNTGAIVGGVMGGIIALLILTLLFLLCYQRRPAYGASRLQDFFRSTRRAVLSLTFYHNDQPGTPTDFYPSKFTTSPSPIIPFSKYKKAGITTGRYAVAPSDTNLGYGVGFFGRQGSKHYEKNRPRADGSVSELRHDRLEKELPALPEDS